MGGGGGGRAPCEHLSQILVCFKQMCSERRPIVQLRKASKVVYKQKNDNTNKIVVIILIIIKVMIRDVRPGFLPLISEPI